MLATSLRPPADPQCRGFSEEPQMLQPIYNANQYQADMYFANVQINIRPIRNANQYQADLSYVKLQIRPIYNICKRAD